MKLLKNDILEGRVENLGNSGEAVLRFERFPVFADYGLPGEKVRVKILRVNDTHGFGKIMNIEEDSPERQTPPCPYYYTCGGCQLQHMKYEAQLDFKRQRVIDCFERIGGFTGINVEKTIGPEKPFFYRNKVQLPLGKKDGKVIMGFYKPRTHTITDIDECIIQKNIFNKIMGDIRLWAEEENIRIYSEEKGPGEKELRHILLRTSSDESEVMVVPVFTTKAEKEVQSLKKRLIPKYPEIKSIVMNLNHRKTNTVLGDLNIRIFGEDTITDRIGKYEFRISPHSFFQINPPMTEEIYKKAVKFSDPKPEDIIFDLYCGAGTISLYISEYVKKVYGIEIVQQAIEDAMKNAERNNVSNTEFILGKSEEKIDDLIKRGIRPDTVILDPPRKGCEESLLKKIAEIKPDKITYVSCNPATQARDCVILKDEGYTISRIQPIDNFPQSSHIETIVVMSKLTR